MDDLPNTILKIILITCMFLLPVVGITFLFCKKLIEHFRKNKGNKDQKVKGILIGLFYLLLVLGGLQLFLMIFCWMLEIDMSWLPKWVTIVNIILVLGYFSFILPIVYGLGPAVAASGIGSKKMVDTVRENTSDQNKNNNVETNAP